MLFSRVQPKFLERTTIFHFHYVYLSNWSRIGLECRADMLKRWWHLQCQWHNQKEKKKKLLFGINSMTGRNERRHRHSNQREREWKKIKHIITWICPIHASVYSCTTNIWWYMYISVRYHTTIFYLLSMQFVLIWFRDLNISDDGSWSIGMCLNPPLYLFIVWTLRKPIFIGAVVRCCFVRLCLFCVQWPIHKTHEHIRSADVTTVPAGTAGVDEYGVGMVIGIFHIFIF